MFPRGMSRTLQYLPPMQFDKTIRVRALAFLSPLAYPFLFFSLFLPFFLELPFLSAILIVFSIYTRIEMGEVGLLLYTNSSTKKGLVILSTRIKFKTSLLRR